MKFGIKRFFAILLLLSFSAGICAMPSYADNSEFEAKCTVENGVYDITGNGNTGYINCIIMPADDSVAELSAEKLAQPEYIAFSAENGTGGFKKSFTLPESFADGEYKTVAWDGAEEYALYFMSGSEAYKNGLLGEKAKNGMLAQAIERYGEQYGIDAAVYAALKAEVKAAVEAELGAVSITDFAAQYNESVLKASFECLEDTQDVYSILVILKTDFTYYNKLSGEEREQVLLKLLKNLPDAPQRLKALAEEYSEDAYRDSGSKGTGGSGSSSLGPSAGSSIVKTDGFAASQGGVGANVLSDISGHWAERVISELAEKGIVSGSDDGKFYPDSNITRAEFSKMLAEAIGAGSYVTQPLQFTDTDSGAWYYGYVAALYGMGIISGYEDQTFRPGESISRQDMAVMIYRVLEQRGIKLENEKEFSDKAEIGEYAQSAVARLAGEGIVSGSDDGNFKPNALLTRAEAASVMFRVSERLGNAFGLQSVRNNENEEENDADGADAKQSVLVKKELTKREARIAEAEQLIPKLLNRQMRGVTRAGFISDVSDLINTGNTTAKEQYYTDLPLSRAEASSVQAMADRGFIAADGEFYPDDVIDASDAIQIMVCALGYKEFAEAAGGWPTGYMKAAEKADLWYGVSKAATGKLDEEAAKLMLLNMLRSKTVTIGGVSSSGAEYVVDEETLLESVFGIYVSDGIVEETTLNSLKRTGISKEGSVYVDGVKYKVSDGDEDYLDYLGYRVNAYHTDDNELYMLAKTEKNTTVTFPADGARLQDALTVKYEYEATGKASRYKLDTDYCFLYNGALSNRLPGSALSEANDGTVELLDNDNDGQYEIISVKNPEYVLVDSTSKINKLIYDKNSSENMLDLFDDDIIFHIEGRNGKKLRFLDIAGGEIYELYATEDKKLVNMKLMSKTVVGSASVKDSEKVTVNGTEYKTTEYFDKYYSDILQLGSSCSFTVSSSEKLIAFSEAGSGMAIGYISAAGWLEAREEECMYIRLFTQDNRFETYTAEDKVKIDGESFKISRLYEKLLNNGELNDQLVGYYADENGRIKAIDFAEVNSVDEIGKKRNDDNSLTEYKFNQASFYYKDVVELMYPSFNISGSTVFVIPNDIQNRDNFKVTNSAFFEDSKSYSNLRVYNLSETGTAGIVVARSDTAIPALTKYTGSFVVEKVQEEWDEDEAEAAVRVYGWEDQKYRSYFIDDDISLYKASGEKLGFGDVIRFTAENDVIKRMICDFDANEAVFARNSVADAAEMNVGNKDCVYQFGEAYMLGGGYIYIGGGDDGRNMSSLAVRNFAVNTQNVAVIDMNDHAVRTGTLSDIRTYKNYGAGDFVLIRQRNLFTMAVYVYVR